MSRAALMNGVFVPHSHVLCMSGLILFNHSNLPSEEDVFAGFCAGLFNTLTASVNCTLEMN